VGVVPAEEKPAVRRRRPRLEVRPVVAVVIFGPVAALAPEPFLQAAAAAGVILASWLWGYYEGRADLARDLIMRSR
jgi:hypothetical protein